MASEQLEQLLSNLRSLIRGLSVVPTDGLPDGFLKDVLTPVQESDVGLEHLTGRNAAFELLTDLTELGENAEDRHWYFWEQARAMLARFVRADECIAWRCSDNGLLHKIHPLEAEEDAVEEVWPESARGAIAWVSHVSYKQYCFVRFGQVRHPIVLLFRTEAPTPPIMKERLALLSELSVVLFHLMLSRVPKAAPRKAKEILIDGALDAPSHKIMGKDPEMLRAVASAEQAAGSDACVYLNGESGTGKELFAKHVHQLSDRVNGPFIPINCSAIPHELIESEMFGHEKGAFTGAYFRKIGKVEQANGGTLFLDEIGEMPLPFQAKLLRFLQEKKFTRVGGNVEVSSDARIVVATHRDLKDMASQGLFREDLYYRVNVIRIDIPPLRDRGRDIRYLAEFFFNKYISKSRASRRTVDETVFDVLERYTFPGNVRELDNIIQRTTVMTQKPVITAEDLPEDLFKAHEGDSQHHFKLHPFEKFDAFLPGDRDTLRELKKEVEHIAFSYQRDLDRRFLLYLLEQSGGSARKAAELADINRTLFYKLLKRAGLDIGLLKKDES